VWKAAPTSLPKFCKAQCQHTHVSYSSVPPWKIIRSEAKVQVIKWTYRSAISSHSIPANFRREPAAVAPNGRATGDVVEGFVSTAVNPGVQKAQSWATTRNEGVVDQCDDGGECGRGGTGAADGGAIVIGIVVSQCLGIISGNAWGMTYTLPAQTMTS